MFGGFGITSDNFDLLQVRSERVKSHAPIKTRVPKLSSRATADGNFYVAHFGYKVYQWWGNN